VVACVCVRVLWCCCCRPCACCNINRSIDCKRRRQQRSQYTCHRFFSYDSTEKKYRNGLFRSLLVTFVVVNNQRTTTASHEDEPSASQQRLPRPPPYLSPLSQQSASELSCLSIVIRVIQTNIRSSSKPPPPTAINDNNQHQSWDSFDCINPHPKHLPSHSHHRHHRHRHRRRNQTRTRPSDPDSNSNTNTMPAGGDLTIGCT